MGLYLSKQANFCIFSAIQALKLCIDNTPSRNAKKRSNQSLSTAKMEYFEFASNHLLQYPRILL
jgi:hypothetical protein